MGLALRLLRTGAMTLAWLMVLPCIVIVLAALIPVVPWLRIYAVSVVPNHTAWLFVWSLAALLIAMLAWSRGKTPVAASLVAAGSFATLAVAAMFVHLLYVGESNGARIDVVRALSLRDFSEGTAPDETAVYAKPGGEALALDIYRPAARRRALSPVLLVVHGGGFVEGSRTFGAANMRWYADRGWTVVSVDYRLARPDRPTWNLAAQDVECAMAWTAANAPRLGLDMRRLTVSGASAGGSLAMTAAFAANARRPASGCGAHLPRVAVVVVKVPLIDAMASWYNPGEMRPMQRSYLTQYLGGAPDVYPDRYAAVDLRHAQRPTNPPLLILGGASDPLIPPEPAAEFARRANAAGTEARHILFPYSGHDFNTTYDGVTNQALRQIIEQFMIEHDAGPDRPPVARASSPSPSPSSPSSSSSSPSNMLSAVAPTRSLRGRAPG